MVHNNFNLFFSDFQIKHKNLIPHDTNNKRGYIFLKVCYHMLRNNKNEKKTFDYVFCKINGIPRVLGLIFGTKSLTSIEKGTL